MPDPRIFPGKVRAGRCRVAVIWIDWYAYHVARLAGLQSAPTLAGRVVGIEMVGGIGVHAGLKFREDLPPDSPIETLYPDKSWASVNKLALAFRLWRRLSALNPETVLVPGYYTLPAIAAALWARLHRRNSVLMTESCGYDHRRSAWKEAVKATAIRLLFNWAVAGGKDHIAYLRDLHVPQERIVRFYDVVDNDRFRDGVAELRRGTELRGGTATEHGLPSRYFLYVGRLAHEKNVRGLLAAWLAYRFNKGTWALVLAGDGPEAPMLREILRDSPFRDDVYFTGLRSSEQLLPLYAFASCFVLPSRREPWGLVVNEAMASGLPVLVSDRCGCAQDLVQHGRNGWIFDAAKESLLTRHLHAIEALPLNELQEAGRHAAEHVRTYSPANFGLQIASVADAPRDRAKLQIVPGQSR